MKRLLSLLLLSLLLLSTLFLLPAFGQESTYLWFHHLAGTSDPVRSVFPDSSGRVWFGTQRGMFRYGDFPEGPRFDLLPGELRRGVIEIGPFPGGRLLVRTSDGRLFVYAPLTNSLGGEIGLYLRRWGLEGMGTRWNLKIHTDDRGVIWCYDSDKLYRVPSPEGKAELVLQCAENIRSLDIRSPRSAVLTDTKLYIFPYGGGEPREIPHGIVFHRGAGWMAVDGDDNIWIGSQNLYRVHGETMETDCLMRDISVMDMMTDSQGDVLVATGTMGILHMGRGGGVLGRLERRPFDGSSLSSNNVRQIARGVDGSLWVCYNKPFVSVCLPGAFPAPRQHILPLQQAGLEENVISMAQAPDGNVWFGTDGQGLFVKDSGTGLFSRLDLGVPQAAVTALFFDSRGRAWVGVYLGGVYCIDGKGITHILPNTSPFDFEEDGQGNIWVAMQGQGVYCIAPDMGSRSIPVDRYDRWVYQVAWAGDDLYGVTSTGIISYDRQEKAFNRKDGNLRGTQSFRNHHFTSAVTDSRGLMWLVGDYSEVPVEIYDIRNDTILNVPLLQGSVVKGIVEDDDHNMWLSTDKNLVHVILNYHPRDRSYSFHPTTYTIRDLGETDNLNNNRSVAKLSDGTLLFGGTHGYESIRVSAFPPHAAPQSPPAVTITGLRLENEDVYTGVPYGGRVILPRDISAMEGIKLRHDESDIALVVSVVDYTSPFETELYYRLQGEESGWKILRGPILELPHLSSGHYMLEIHFGDPSSGYSARVSSLDIDILPPWYASWWAFLLYGVAGILALYLLVSFFRVRHRHRLSIEKVREEAEREHQLNEMKLRFFTNISHDFRTPLSLIIIPLESYLKDPSHASEHAYFQPVYRSAVRLLNLVNQILDIRKLEAGGVRLHLSYGDLVPFLRDTCSYFTLYADQMRKSLTFEAGVESLPTAFDKDKLSKIVTNLLSNAFKFAGEEGNVHVSLSSDEGQAVVSIADDGPGIPDSQKEVIFDQFYQIEGGRSSSNGGTGVGLSIVKEFVTLMGGDVTVRDNDPHGAVFTISFPLRGSEEAAGGDDAGSPGEEPSSRDGGPSAPAEGKTLLLVEDNVDFRNFLSGQLSDEYRVLPASDGKSALEVLGKEDVDVIVSDIMMEGMDGLELCRAVKSRLEISHIPIILLTAKAMAEDEVQGLEAGADDYITKPFRMEILRLRLGKILDARSEAHGKFNAKMDIAPSEITITSLDEQFLAKAISLTEENMGDPDFSVEKLSSLLSMHRANLYKKILSLTGRTPVEFIRILRLKRAAQYLSGSQLYISEIAFRVGFNSPKLFSRYFRDEFGMTPSEYQQKYESSRD